MALFRLHCTFGGAEKTYIYDSVHAEIVDECSGNMLYYPHAIPHEDEVNSVPPDESSCSQETVLVPKDNIAYSFLFKSIVEKHCKFLRDPKTLYLSDPWYRIRKFYATQRDHTHQKLGNCPSGHECPVSRFCAQKRLPSECVYDFWTGFAELRTMLQRITSYSLYRIECLSSDGDYSIHGTANKIAYMPLDLGVVPEVGISRLKHWAISARTHQKEVLKTFDRTNTIYDQGYDLEDPSMFISIVTHPITSEWFAEFDKHFPELVEFFNKYPVNNKQIMACISSSTLRVDENARDFYHMDWDSEKMGFRLYVVKDDKNRLTFRKLLPQYTKYYQQRAGRRATVPEHHMQKEVLHANTLKEPHAWVMDTQQTAHAVQGFHDQPRAVFLIYGDIDVEAFARVCRKSVEKYADRILIL